MKHLTSRGIAIVAVGIFLIGLFHLGIISGIQADQKRLRVLFIGNSLTYTNDLPAILESLAKASAPRRLEYKMVAFPNFSLEDHWNKKDAREAIQKGRWDFVVLQQGPSASREGRAVLLDYTRRFSELIRQIGAETALYSVWPASDRKQDFEGVTKSYKLAAEAAGGIVFPVGEAWVNAWRVNPSIELYGVDGFHPSDAGSYLAALVMYARLYGRSPLGLPAKVRLHTGRTIEISPDQAVLLQNSAEQANKQFGVR